MTLSASFIRNSELLLKENRQKNLKFLNEQYGLGFQALLFELLKKVEKRISQSEISNLVNAAIKPNGSQKSEFDTWNARHIEQALDLPMCSLDLPSWHFQSNIDYLWQYAERTSSDREWFDGLLKILLNAPFKENKKSIVNADQTQINPVILERIQKWLQKKQIANGNKLE